MANTENIEAKLCAYIDGELDAQGRAEIEKHLAANPQHAALIGELSKQRDLLRELPRESAPEEIIDALQNQMERSVLLGDDDGGGPPETIRLSRWPQVFAAAAMLLLTVGLGAVIYYVLPRGDARNNEFAITSGAAATADGPRAASSVPEGSVARFERDTMDKAFADASVPARERSIEPLPGKSAAPEALMSKAKGGPADESAAGAVADRSAVRQQADVFAPSRDAVALSDLRAAQDRLQGLDLTRQLKDAPGGLGDNAMFVVVSTADPDGARSQVTDYLALNKISWDPLTHPIPQIDVAKEDVNLARQQRTQVNMKTPGGAAAAPAAAQPGPAEVAQAPQEKIEGKSGVAGAGAAGAAAAQQQAAKQGAAAPPPAQPGIADAGERTLGVGAQQGVMSNAIMPDEGLLQATSSPVRPEAQQVQQELQTQQRREVQQPAKQQGQRFGHVVSAERGDQSSRLIIARGMTKRQAAELSTNLSKQTSVQRAAVYEQRRGGGGGGGGGVGLDSQTRVQTIPLRASAAAPTTSPSTNPAPAAAQALDAVPSPAPQIATDAADVDVARLHQQIPATAPPPTGATEAELVPVDVLAAAGAVPATAPSTLPTSGPTLDPLVAEADEPIDVVILVQDDLADALGPAAPDAMPNAAFDDPAAAAAAPATQPAPPPVTPPAPATQPAH